LSELNGMLDRLGGREKVKAILDRIGLRGPVGEWVHWATSTAARDRWRILQEDLEACQTRFRRISSGAPSGDLGSVAWVICTLPTVWSLKMDGILSLGTRLQNLRPVAVHLQYDTWARRYQSLFGLEEIIYFPKFLSAAPAVPLAAKIREFVESRPQTRDLLRLTYRDVDVGRIALSNVLNRHKFAKFDLGQRETLSEVASELVKIQRNVHAAEVMIARHRPTLALLLEKGLSPMAEIFGVCINEGIPVVQYVGSQRMNHYVLKRYSRENRHQHPFSLDDRSWDRVKRMPWGPTQEAELIQEFEESYRKGSWFNRKFLHEGKRIKSAEAVRQQLGLDPARKTVVIFSHVLWDATFFYGEGLFDDYETWLLETVRAACANPRVNWVIKLHPDLVWKLKYEGYTGELRDIIAVRGAMGNLPDHVKLVAPDTDINTFSFFEITDYCVTVRGTIGIEMACRGIPVLTAGTGRYSGMGFTIDSGSASEYLERLARIEMTPPTSPGEVELARRFAYALFQLRIWDVRSVEMVKLPIEQTGHPLDHNLVAHVESFAQLANQEDMRRFANWLGSDEVDYLNIDPLSAAT